MLLTTDFQFTSVNPDDLDDHLFCNINEIFQIDIPVKSKLIPIKKGFGVICEYFDDSSDFKENSVHKWYSKMLFHGDNENPSPIKNYAMDEIIYGYCDIDNTLKDISNIITIGTIVKSTIPKIFQKLI